MKFIFNGTIKLFSATQRKDRKTNDNIVIFQYGIQAENNETLSLFSMKDFSNWVDKPGRIVVNVREFQGTHRLSLAEVLPNENTVHPLDQVDEKSKRR